MPYIQVVELKKPSPYVETLKKFENLLSNNYKNILISGAVVGSLYVIGKVFKKSGN